MAKYELKKKDMNFQTMESLKPVEQVIEDANTALNDKSRKIKDSPLGETIAGVLGTGTGAGIGFAGLYFGGITGLSAAGITSGLAAAGGIVGGGMAAGLVVLAAPAVVLGGAGIGMASAWKKKRLKESKELLYKEAIAKQTAIIKALREENQADKERIQYLTGLNIILQSVIKSLQHDLGKES